MQIDQIERQFSTVERSIEKATQMCSRSSNVPQNLRACLQELDQQSDRARQALQSRNNAQITQCIDQLENFGDKAMQECRQAGNVDQQLASVVKETHDAISQLKHQIH